MKEVIKQTIRSTSFYHPLRNWMVKRRLKQELVKWEKNGKPSPPPHIVKQQTLQTYAQKYDLKVLVETGTYYGDMIEAMKNVFDKIYSIELSQELFERAKKRFKNQKQVELIQGDSGIELKSLMNKIDRPTLFWLDGHYSAGETAKGDKETPIFEELQHIFDTPDLGHVIIIDDARSFGLYRDYPTIEQLNDFIKLKRPNMDVSVQYDSVRIAPKA
jgi:DREV methyltransferase